jgi:hypothetical protein
MNDGTFDHRTSKPPGKELEQLEINIRNNLSTIEDNIRSTCHIDNNIDIINNIKYSHMNFLYEMWSDLDDPLQSGQVIDDHRETIDEKGKITIPRNLVDEIVANFAIVFCDTEDKFISLILLDESIEPCWLDIVHTDETNNIMKITNLLKEDNCNILYSFNRLERMNRQAHFNVILDIKGVLSNKTIDEKLMVILNNLKKERKIINVLLKDYDTEAEKIVTKTKVIDLIP